MHERKKKSESKRQSEKEKLRWEGCEIEKKILPKRQANRYLSDSKSDISLELTSDEYDWSISDAIQDSDSDEKETPSK